MGNTITCGPPEVYAADRVGVPDCFDGSTNGSAPQSFMPETPVSVTDCNGVHGDDPGRNKDWDWLIGVSFSMGSSVLSCLGLILQKVAHNQNQAAPEGKKYKVMAGIICSPAWWAAFVVMGLFPFPLDFFAYSFAAQSLVAVFAGFTLVCNQIMAPCILKERLTKTDMFASFVVVVGTTIATFTGSHKETEFDLCELLDMCE